jgi:hypothetical protein
MVQVASLIGEITRAKNELERSEALRGELEVSLSRALVLLESCSVAISRNDRHALEQLAGVIGEFLSK